MENKKGSFFNQKNGQVLGILFIVLGIILLNSGIIVATCFILAGIVLTTAGDNFLQKKKISLKKEHRIMLSSLFLVLAMFVVANGSETPVAENTVVTAPADTVEKVEADVPTLKTESKTVEPVTTQVPEAPKQEPVDTATLGEKQALQSAKKYLNYSSFSRKGLIKQLEYEGFTNDEAVYGVEQSNADWNAQAAMSAKKYIEYTSFSRSGLIEQLEYEGYTRQQAEHGANAVGY